MSDETLEHAAKALALEVRGHLALHNDELREMTGHTNVGVLKHWMEAVLEALEAAAPHREYGEGDAETLEHAAKLLALTVRGHLGLHDEELREMTGNSNVAVLRHWMEAVFAALAGEGGTEAQHKIDRLRISLESLREHHDETVRRLRKTEQDRDDAYNLLVKAGWVPHWGLKHAEEVIAERVRLYELVTDFLRDIPGDDGCDDPVGAVEGWVRCGSCWPCRIKILRDEISAQPPASDTESADTLTAGSDNRDVEQVDCTEGSADEWNTPRIVEEKPGLNACHFQGRVMTPEEAIAILVRQRGSIAAEERKPLVDAAEDALTVCASCAHERWYQRLWEAVRGEQGQGGRVAGKCGKSNETGSGASDSGVTSKPPAAPSPASPVCRWTPAATVRAAGDFRPKGHGWDQGCGGWTLHLKGRHCPDCGLPIVTDREEEME